MTQRGWLKAMLEQGQNRAQLEYAKLEKDPKAAAQALPLEEYSKRILVPMVGKLHLPAPQQAEVDEICQRSKRDQFDHWNYIWTRYRDSLYEHLGDSHPMTSPNPTHNVVNGVCTRCNSAHPEEHEICVPQHGGEAANFAPAPSRRILAADDFDIIGARLEELRAERGRALDTTPAEEP